MTSLHRHARFELLVAILVVVAVAGLYLWSGNAMASLAGFSVLALIGARLAVQSAHGDSGMRDERDEIINQRATVTGYTVLWLALVVWGVAVPLRFADQGSVPFIWVAPVVWVAFWLVTLVRSVTILVLDRRGM